MQFESLWIRRPPSCGRRDELDVHIVKAIEELEKVAPRPVKAKDSGG
jgi:hypothetical protein